jgi:hypothetical protein
LLSVVPVPDISGDQQQHDPVPAAGEPGLADIITLQRRRAAEISEGDEEGFFLDTIAEYQWARDAAGLAQATLDGWSSRSPRSASITAWPRGGWPRGTSTSTSPGRASDLPPRCGGR